MSKSSSKSSANDNTDIPIHRPSDPPRSETKFASCKIIITINNNKTEHQKWVDISDRVHKNMLAQRAQRQSQGPQVL